jgi:O-acetyl-ADP-ribose deacetylase (regulator of RNase III)
MIKENLLNKLLDYLINEDKEVKSKIGSIPKDYDEKRSLLRGLMNIRGPLPIDSEILELQDELLSIELGEKTIINPYDLPAVSQSFKNTNVSYAEKLSLWRGDITCLSADAIVNAANSRMLGCFVPLHRCIDNVIHSAAGIQLRLECNNIMINQGVEEPTGQAKMTCAYNLPCRYILHTVGPIIYEELTDDDCKLLASCYKSCLDKANEHEDIKTIAFCCISTGEFKFPKDRAAQIAVNTICDWLETNNNRFDRIIFNVFTEDDYNVYSKLFR